tara:strand:+ start:343 stop:681 length:339 start_codon:yes stop_codon:yes gene_type:complete
MNSRSLEDLISTLNNKLNETNEKFQEVKNLDKSELNMNYDNVNLIESISSSIHLLSDKIDDLRIELLKIQDSENLTHKQKLDLREARFQKLLQRTFLPYILYLKICTDNSDL